MNMEWRLLAGNILLILLLHHFFICSLALPGVGIGIGFAVASVVSLVAKKGYCRFAECCEKRWTAFNITGLEKEFDRVVFGQHIVRGMILTSIQYHVTHEKPRKALVLSFHGWRGSGKTHVADVIVKYLYRHGAKSRYVHKIVASHDFTDHTRVDEYKENLRYKIIKGVKDCARSIFIIDDVEKMPRGIIDVIKPFIDYHEYVDGVDYRSAIFILLSNVAGKEINQYTLTNMKTGKKREELSHKDMHYFLNELAMDRYGGLQDSFIVSSELVDWFVPFLPLEKKHVKLCIKAELKKYTASRGGISDSLLEELANELSYVPKDQPVFSTSGCKRVEKIVARHIALLS